MQLEKLKSKKMSFDLAKHGLNLKKGFKTNLVSFWRTKKGNEERRRGEGEEEEEAEKKKKRGGDQAKRYGTTNLGYGSYGFCKEF